jgi:hypothetical protein
MAELSRYNVNGKGSNILANKLKITDPKILTITFYNSSKQKN